MSNLFFDLQRFAATVEDGKVTIPAGDTYALDGVTYTAINDAQLNLDSDGKVSGIASGSVSAVVTGRSNPVATVDASDGAINFAATGSGSVLTVTRPFPMELISGEFTYKGNTLTTSAGARLAFVSQLGSYSLRDESVYESGATFTFTNTALNINSEHTTSVYTLTNGSDVRRLQIETFGPVVNNYSERGFRLLKGSSEVVTVGGYTVTATAKDDATLNLELGANGLTLVPTTGDGSLNVALSRGGTEILAGELNVTSGSITFGYDNKVTFAKDTSWDFTWNGYTMTATTTDEATLDIALTGNKLSFTPGQNDGGLNLLLRRGTTPVFAGVLNVTDGTITFDANTQKFSFTEGTNISLTLSSTPPRQVDFKVTGGDASIKIEAGTDGKFILTPDDNDGALQISVSREGQTVFQNTFSVSGGSIVFDPATQSVGLTKDTSVSLGLNNYTVTATATDDAGFGIGLLSDGRIVLTPQDNDGSLNIAIRRGNTTIFQNTVSVSGGSITVNPETLAMTLSKGTNISLSFGNYELNATTTADATVGIAITGSGIAITPTPGDGSLNLTINSAGGSLSANVEVVSGSFILGDGGLLTVAKDTELKIDFGDGYIINFKATDDAGGSLTLGANGITFAPNTQDGGLQLSITRDGQTRTASLDVTGSVTYSLDGSISLAKGTVVRNVFDSGNVLTITANTNASGSMVFTPQNGLTITPSTPDALNVVLETDGVEVVNISSIDGSINYTGGVVTASDGTKAHISYYFGWESELRTKGGTASLQFTADRTIYTANEGATFLIDYLDRTTTEIQNGTYSDIYATETSEAIELISEGSIFKNNDNEQVFTLEKAGNYILNGMNIATTKDGVQVQLSNYDTVTFAADAGIVFDGQEFSGDGIITITNGAIVIENTEDNVAVNGTALNDNITNTGDNVTISALGGNDTIYSSGNGAIIDGGAGNNTVSLDGGGEGSNIVFDGNTTVEGFKTGWSNGSDTLYINKGSDPGVDFKSDGLTFYDDNDSLTLDDVDDTAKINLYYEASDKISRNVYIARNDWYQVSNSDLTVDSGEGIYFVGTSATHNHGVDFSGVSQPLNVTMNTDYAATNNSIWVNNVYSIRGGAGNTTITGTDDSDTIIAGRGSATIDGAGGGDRISLGSAAALVKYTAGDGSDSIYGFNANSTISISGASYSSTKRGNNLILTVGSDNVTLFGAAALTNPNIIGTASSSSTTSGGGSSSTTSGGSSSSTTKGGDSSISGGDSSISGGDSSISGGGSSISGGGSSTSSVRGSSTSTTSSGSVDEVLTQLTGRRSSSTSGTSSTSTTSGSSSTSSVRGTSSTSSISTVSLTSTISGGSSTSSVRGISTATISSTSTPDYVYTGGDAVITNYTPGEKIALGTPPTSGTFVDGNFVLTSASGNLVVENAANKVVEFTDGNGNAYIKAYAATNPSTIDGRGLAGFEIINGSEGNDFIYAGDGGSQLWGGSGTASDLLTGGAGTDIFVGGRYQGADIFNNAETKDEVHLNDATLSDIIATSEQNGLVAISFNTGNSVAIQSTEALSAAVILADGSKYRYNHATKGWQTA